MSNAVRAFFNYGTTGPTINIVYFRKVTIALTVSPIWTAFLSEGPQYIFAATGSAISIDAVSRIGNVLAT